MRHGARHGFVWLAALAAGAAPQPFLKQYCAPCHSGKNVTAGFDIATVDEMVRHPQRWLNASRRVAEHQMPPRGVPAPSMAEREQFQAWVNAEIRRAACAGGPVPGPAPLRRLSRSEYAATLRDLLGVHVNVAQGLPADGAGGEGFDNAAETLFLSPIHAEKYWEAARLALNYAAKDPRARARFIYQAGPEEGFSQTLAARNSLEYFLPRAFRRPVSREELAPYVALYQSGRRRGDSFDDALLRTLEAALLSPRFLFRVEPPNPGPAARRLDDYSYASRLSYFLWGTMPDEELFRLAARGQLQDRAVVEGQIRRMLADVRARDFAESFVEQWLGTRELGRDIRPDEKKFPQYYDQDLSGSIRYEPILFFQEIFAQDLSLLNFIDSRFTILTTKLARHYGFDVRAPEFKGINQQPQRFDLPPGSPRGGVLGMAAVLAVSSYPTRISPVLRGKWVLDNFLGTPPPPPPPNVPELKTEGDAGSARSLRQLLEQHRANPNCASCHSRIDPLGFGLQNFDVLGRWLETEGGQPVDASGELPDGRRFEGLTGLKQVLLERREVVIENLVAKMLGYALGRGLTIEDRCVVEQITARLAESQYSAHTLIREIVESIPFRYQAPALGDGSSPARKRTPAAAINGRRSEDK